MKKKIITTHFSFAYLTTKENKQNSSIYIINKRFYEKNKRSMWIECEKKNVKKIKLFAESLFDYE